MARGDREETFINLLESIAGKYYPGLYAFVDEPVQDLTGIPGLRAHLVISESPSMQQEYIRALVVVAHHQNPGANLTPEWRSLLKSTVGKDFRVDLYVRRQDVRPVQEEAQRVNPEARVFPLPKARIPLVVGALLSM
jgi:hypothetical protein